MIGIFATQIDEDFAKTLAAMDKATNEWEARAARGECGWICSSCCISFPEGMPDECNHGDAGCTEIIVSWKEKVKKVP
jgi:hypothetical protein